MIKKPLKKWAKKIWKAFKKKFPLSLINIILILFLTYLMLDIVLSFSAIAFLGYLFYSISNLDKLIKHPFKSLTWAAIYIICAILFDILLSKALPMISKGTGASIFSGIFLTITIIFFWIKIRKMK